MRFTFIGLSITSSWGNGHATTYRALIRELARRGHEVLFLERDVPWYAENRDMPDPPFCRTVLYGDLDELRSGFASDVRGSDVVIVGSYVPEGVAVGEWAVADARGVSAFYDIDTPITITKLEQGDREYLAPELIPRYDLYLSFTGGPTLDRLEREFGSPAARALYCSVDPDLYAPDAAVGRTPRWDLGYMGTYSDDRQPTLQRLLVDAAQLSPGARFVVAGPKYPPTLSWPANVERIEHLAPAEHRTFYAQQRFTLNVTRAEMIRAGWSPSVRLFEAAACGTPIISDAWDGLEAFFEPGREILIAHSADETLRHLAMREEERVAIAERARARVLAEHTAARRAAELEGYVLEQIDRRAVGAGRA